MNKSMKETLINIGTGKDYSIKFYAKLLLQLIYPEKKVTIVYDKSKPNGTPRKVLSISLAKKYGWYPKHDLKTSIINTYQSFLNNNLI